MFILTIFFLLIGLAGMYLWCRPKMLQTEKINQQIIEQNTKNQQQLENLSEDLSKLYIKKEKVNKEYLEIEKTLQDKKLQTEQEYNQIITGIQDSMDREIEKINQNFQNEKERYNKEYSKVMVDTVRKFEEEYALRNKELQELKDSIEYEKSIATAAIEANKRAEAKKIKQDFYKIILSQEDINEIAALRQTHIRQIETLNKVIWKVYYEKPTNDLINRVAGAEPKTGIYKITNLENGMCYVGQAVNIADRWKQHIKRGIGADTPTRNKLYPAMLATGVENFSFEIIEECSRTLLNEKEDYWQEYFQAKEFGYSIK